MLPPRGQEKSLPFLKQVPRILEEQRVMRTRPVRKMAEKKKHWLKDIMSKELNIRYFTLHCTRSDLVSKRTPILSEGSEVSRPPRSSTLCCHLEALHGCRRLLLRCWPSLNLRYGAAIGNGMWLFLERASSSCTPRRSRPRPRQCRNPQQDRTGQRRCNG